MQPDLEEGTIVLADRPARELAEIAARNGLSLAGALWQAVKNERFLCEQEAAGARLLMEKKSGGLVYLVRKPALA